MFVSDYIVADKTKAYLNFSMLKDFLAKTAHPVQIPSVTSPLLIQWRDE